MLLPISSTTSCRIKDIREEAPSALQIRPTSVDIFTISSGLLQDQVHKERTPQPHHGLEKVFIFCAGQIPEYDKEQ